MKKFLPTLFYAALSLSYQQVAQAGVGLPNPAAKSCVDLGGVLQSYVKADGGDAITLCAFNDDVYLNGLIEQWTLFRHKNASATPSMAVKAYLDHVAYQAPQSGPVGHPALRYCEQLGGNRFVIREISGDESGVCEFEDGSQIEEWTLFRGPAIHQSLSKALQ